MSIAHADIAVLFSEFVVLVIMLICLSFFFFGYVRVALARWRSSYAVCEWCSSLCLVFMSGRGYNYGRVGVIFALKGTIEIY